MTDSVLTQIAGLSSLDHNGLNDLWRTLYGKEPPAYNRQFVISRLAYRLQEIAYGGLSDETKTKMKDVLASSNMGGKKSTSNKTKQRIRKRDMPIYGTRLVRDWNGHRYEVIAVPGGFEYDGMLYRSLSAIAKAITGTHWNGKLFFGIAKSKVAKAGHTR
jgi:hypothetical protein